MSYDASTGLAGFDIAIVGIKRGEKWRRAGWNGKGMWVTRHPPVMGDCDGTGLFIAESLWMKTAGNSLVPWLASQTDLLANDWEVAW